MIRMKSPMQLENTLSPIDATPSGRLILLKLLHRANAHIL